MAKTKILKEFSEVIESDGKQWIPLTRLRGDLYICVELGDELPAPLHLVHKPKDRSPGDIADETAKRLVASVKPILNRRKSSSSK